TQAIGQAMGLADVTCPHSRGKAKSGLIAASNHFLRIFESQNTHDGAKDLLLSDLHGVLYVPEYGGFNEIALAVDAVAAGEKAGPFFFARCNKAHDAVTLFLRNLRPLRCFGIEGVTNFLTACPFDDFFHELIVNLVLDKKAAAGAAALALVEEETKVSAFDG